MSQYTKKNNQAFLYVVLMILSPNLAAGQIIAEADRSAVRPQNPVTAVFGEYRESPRIKNIFAESPAPVRGVGSCGDASPDPGEECDDGNATSGDGCSPTCMVEPGFDCTAAIAGQTTVDHLDNGSFELDDGSWAISGFTAGRCDSSCSGGDNFASDGEWWLWIGGTGDTPNSGTASQIVVVPVADWTISFDLLSAASGCGDSTIAIWLGEVFGGTQIWSYEEQGNGECQTAEPFEYERVEIDFSVRGDLPVRLSIYGDYVPAGDGSNANWFLDNFKFETPLIPPIPPTPSMCTAIVCGDGLLGSTEQCDDGNIMDGDGCSSSCEIEQPDFVCEDPVPPADSGEVIKDGGLETGNPNDFWESTGTVYDPICSQVLCGAYLGNSGEYFLWFGGVNVPNFQTVTQEVTIPVTATHLEWQELIGVCDNKFYDVYWVAIDGDYLFTQYCDHVTSEYQTRSLSLGGLADGGVHTIEFGAGTDPINGGNSNFFIDDISLRDNVPFAGEPGQCRQLPRACGPIEQFETWPPPGWTILNEGASPSGWGASSDGVCASANWSTPDPFANVTKGGGIAACADSDAAGSQEMDTYLCSPAIDLSTPPFEPRFNFLANYQSFGNALNDNGTPGDPGDDFDDDFLEVLVGTAPPTSLSVQSYDSLGQVQDHLDATILLSPADSYSSDLSAYLGESAVHVCFRYRGNFDWFGQVDNAGLRATACSAEDSDGDGVPDEIDNCADVATVDQRDTDGDGYGNICDGDLNNDCKVNFLDLGIFRSLLFSSDPDADLDGNGVVNFIDLSILNGLFFAPPGPGTGDCPSP